MKRLKERRPGMIISKMIWRLYASKKLSDGGE
jgi:hypothetical protein